MEVGIMDVDLINTYSCQFCHKEFKTKEDLKIIPGQSPLCSYKCKFNLVYRILKAYEEEDLVFLFKNLFRTPKTQLSKQEMVFRLSVYFTKVCFYTQKDRLRGSRLGSEAQELETGSEAQHLPPYIYKGDEPESEPILSLEEK